MAVYSKSINANTIKDGCATISKGTRTLLYHDATRNHEYVTIDDQPYIVNLDTRFLVDPSGWNS